LSSVSIAEEFSAKVRTRKHPAKETFVGRELVGVLVGEVPFFCSSVGVFGFSVGVFGFSVGELGL
jgi:hypothetical protein